MPPTREQAVVARAARVLTEQLDPCRPFGYLDRSYEGPTADEVLGQGVGEPGRSFDHPWYRLARDALRAADQWSPSRSPREKPPQKTPPGPEYRLGPDQVARPL